MSELTPTSLATKIERSENKLTEAMTKCNISLPGQAWIGHSFDLFKDKGETPPCVGQPDKSARLIYVSTYTQQQQISRPASVPAGSSWDCHIINLQQNNLTNVAQVTFLNNNTVTTTAPNFANVFPYGGVQVLAGATNANLGYANTVANLTLPDTYFRGQSSAKVIGKAHEVLNTTSTLNVQGDLLFYQKTMPDPNDTLIPINIVGPSTVNQLFQGTLQFYDNLSELDTPANLIVLPKARKLLAKEGIYQTCTLCSNDNNAQIDRPIGQLVTGFAGSRLMTVPLFTLTPGPTVPPMDWVSPYIPDGQSPFVSPFNVSGTYFTGLSSETTLTITAKWLVEVSPPVTDTKLMSLSHMSPPDDNCAMELYRQIAYHLEAGTAIKNNADGDWIATVADLAVEFGVPGAAVIRKGVNLARNFYNNSGYASMVNPSANQGNKNVNPKLKSFKNSNFTQKQWDEAASFNSNRINKANKMKKKTGNSKKTVNKTIVNRNRKT